MNEFYLGRVEVPIEGQLCVVQDWLNDALEGTTGGLSKDALRRFEETLARNSNFEGNCKGTKLDIWKAEIVNRTPGDEVFVFKQLSSVY